MLSTPYILQTHLLPLSLCWCLTTRFCPFLQLFIARAVKAGAPRPRPRGRAASSSSGGPSASTTVLAPAAARTGKGMFDDPAELETTEAEVVAGKGDTREDEGLGLNEAVPLSAKDEAVKGGAGQRPGSAADGAGSRGEAGPGGMSARGLQLLAREMAGIADGEGADMDARLAAGLSGSGMSGTFPGPASPPEIPSKSRHRSPFTPRNPALLTFLLCFLLFQDPRCVM